MKTSNLAPQQVKQTMLRLLSGFFFINSILIFIVPLFISKHAISIKPESFEFSLLFLISGIGLLLLESTLDKKDRQQDTDPAKIPALQVICFALIEMILIIAMLSALLMGDLIAYLTLGLLGLWRMGRKTYAVFRG